MEFELPTKLSKAPFKKFETNLFSKTKTTKFSLENHCQTRFGCNIASFLWYEDSTQNINPVIGKQ